MMVFIASPLLLLLSYFFHSPLSSSQFYHCVFSLTQIDVIPLIQPALLLLIERKHAHVHALKKHIATNCCNLKVIKKTLMVHRFIGAHLTPSHQCELAELSERKKSRRLT